MALGSTQPLTETEFLELWEPESPGTLRACPGRHRNFFTFIIVFPPFACIRHYEVGTVERRKLRYKYAQPNDLQRRRALSPLKIKISSKNMREKPTNTPIIHSVY
jgi:hypothetical protein